MVRDLRLLRMFTVLRGGCVVVVPDSAGAAAPPDVLTAALEANQELARLGPWSRLLARSG
jgi:hypothetical protein